ncbi:MAG: phage shock protein operon transcriptional activator [Desulfobacteraceae bacterium]|nr:phage shock protein operon transcriptional activator [Desulfobacteraceae bacterium]
MANSNQIPHSEYLAKSPRGTTEALGQSEVFLAFQENLSKVAPINRPVLLIGERGTGKELAALRLHYLSKRWQNPFVTLNCSALSPSLIESELFGHERGAFTGAAQQRTGRFEMADQGSFLLDEIGNIPLEAQEKILRVVEYGTFERVGSSKPIETDVRIIAATNIDLSEKAEKGFFMKDLLDRLSFEVLYLPPLRARKEDIVLLANHFAARMAFEMGKEDIPRLSRKALDSLLSYPWPGNIRELKNVVERAVYRAQSVEINTIVFNPFSDPYLPSEQKEKTEGEKILSAPLSRISPEDDKPEKTFDETVWDFKVKLLESALEEAKFNQKTASQILGLTYHQFRALYRKYHKGITI